MAGVLSNITWAKEKLCYALPTQLHSGGVFACINEPSGKPELDNLFSGALELFDIQLLIIVLVWNALHTFLRRLGMISFTSQCLAGVILGPTFLGKYEYYKNHIFPHDSQGTLNSAATMGYAMFMFITGVKMDVGMMSRCGRKVMFLGIASVLLPYTIGLICQYNLLVAAPGLFDRMVMVGSTGIQSMTTFPVVSLLLAELKLTNSELGRLALSASLISSLMSFSLELGATIITEVHGVVNAALVLAAGLVAALVLKPVMVWVIGRTPEGQKVHPACVPLLFGTAMVYQIFFDSRKLSHALGAFIVGLAVPPGPPLGSAVVETMEPFTNSVLFPLFVVTAVMRGDMSAMTMDFYNKSYYQASMIMAHVIKFVVCLFLSLPWMPPTDAVVLALIMCSKGMYELGVYTIHRDIESIGEGLFSLSVIAIIINTTVIPLLIKYLYDPSRKYAGYQARNIFSLKPRTELRVLPCIYKTDHIISVINLLDIACPSPDSPIGVFALHLIELVGRATPVFVSHQKQRPVSDSCSIDVILAFNQYERQSHQVGTHATVPAVTVNTFTSISRPKFMSDDICTLALDKETSLLLLPFHIKWGPDGRVEQEDNSFKMVNSKVLERAPCSVGIFFERRSFVSRQTTAPTTTNTTPLHDQQPQPEAADHAPWWTYSVCVIYMGGGDDHEALFFALRAVRDPNMRLTIMHLVTSKDKDGGEDDGGSVGGRRIRTNNRMASETLFDEMVLKEAMKGVSGMSNVRYEEHVVQDGPQTAMLIREIAGDHDLFVVGRRHGVESRHTMGLTEWSEFPELGVVGDLLASPDLETKASVLVVQQQKQFKK